MSLGFERQQAVFCRFCEATVHPELLTRLDVPFLRGPVGSATIWLELKWVALRKWWQRKRRE